MTIFVMHIHRQHCLTCGRDETLSRLYEAKEVHGRPGAAKDFKNCTTISPYDPVNVVPLPITDIPVCGFCVDDSRATLGAEVYASWQETLRRKSSAESALPRFAATSSSKSETLDDIA